MTRRLTLGSLWAFFALFVFVPLGGLLLRGLTSPALAWQALFEPLHLQATARTVALTLGVTLITLLLGVPIGWLVGRTDLPRARAWRTACMLPFLIPPYISAIAWISLLNPSSGLLNRGLANLGLPGGDIYTLGGMIWVMGLAYTPLIMVATADTLARMDASLEEQARICGASPWRVFSRITLPMATPGILGGASLVMAATAASFGVPYLLASGSAEPPTVLTTRIYQTLDLDPATGRPAAVALCLVLLVLGIGIPLLMRRMVGRRQFTTVTGKATRPKPFVLGRARRPAQVLLGLYVGIGVLLPTVTILVTSLMANFGRGLTAANLGLGHYRTVLFERPETLRSIGHSVLLATVVAAVAVVVGLLVSWLADREPTRAHRTLSAVASLPYAIPGTVLALGMLLTFSVAVRFILADRLTVHLELMDTLWILGIAYLIKFLAFPVGSAAAGLKATDASLEQAARLSGATWAGTLRRITLPLLSADLAAAFFLVWIPAFSEVTMSILLTGPDTPVVGTLLFHLQTYGDPPAAAVLAVLVMALVLGGNLLLRRLTGGRLGL